MQNNYDPVTGQPIQPTYNNQQPYGSNNYQQPYNNSNMYQQNGLNNTNQYPPNPGQMQPYLCQQQMVSSPTQKAPSIMLKIALFGGTLVAAILLVFGGLFIYDAVTRKSPAPEVSVTEDYIPDTSDIEIDEPEANTVTDTGITSAPTYSESDSIYSFSLFDVNYTLPLDFSTLLDNGWHFCNEEDKDKQIQPDDSEYVDLYCPGDNLQHFEFRVANFTSAPLNVRDCKATHISVATLSLEKLGTDLRFFGGKLSTRNSSRDEVLAAIGEPKFSNESDSSSSYTFVFENNMDCRIVVSYSDSQHTKWIQIVHHVNE